MASSGSKSWADEAEEEEERTVEEKFKGADLKDDPSIGELKDGELDTPNIDLKCEPKEEPEIKVKYAIEGSKYRATETWEELNLKQELLDALYSVMQFKNPSKIQAQTLPMILTPPHLNLIAQSQSGTGKTACFVLSMLMRCDPALKAPQAICFNPTRELVHSNKNVCTKMGKYTGLDVITTADGHRDSKQQIIEQIVIGTPGTLKRWIAHKQLDLSHIKMIVFDEADQMFYERTFFDECQDIIKKARRGKSEEELQFLLFSATFNTKVLKFIERNIPKANEITLKHEDQSLDIISQYTVRVPAPELKIKVLKSILEQCDRLGQAIVFVWKRVHARALHKQLNDDGFKCTSLDGGMEYEARDHVIQEFKDQKTKILISTDVLARGFDQQLVTLVVNFHVPVKMTKNRGETLVEPAYETYLHRIGRSGRFGRKGAAFNLIHSESKAETKFIGMIQKYFDCDMKELNYEDEKAVEEALKEAELVSLDDEGDL